MAGPDRLLTLERQAELVDVLLAHTLEKVQALRVIRRDAGDAEDAGDLFREAGTGRQRMRTASGPAGDETAWCS